MLTRARLKELEEKSLSEKPSVTIRRLLAELHQFVDALERQAQPISQAVRIDEIQPDMHRITCGHRQSHYLPSEATSAAVCIALEAVTRHVARDEVTLPSAGPVFIRIDVERRCEGEIEKKF